MFYFDGGDYNLPQPDFKTGILEKRIWPGKTDEDSPTTERHRTYIATTGSPPGVPLGLEDVQEESSVYVIRGRW